MKDSRQKPMEFMFPDTDWVIPTELPDLRGRGRIAIDTETKDDGLANNRGPGWAYGAGWICGVSMAAPGAPPVYIPIRHPDTECFDPDAVKRWVSDHMKSNDKKVFQNAPYDLGWFKTEMGISPPELLDDTIGMSYVVDEQRKGRSLDALCAWQGIPGKDESLLKVAIDAIGGKGKGDLWRLPAKYVGVYGEVDAERTLQLADKLDPQIDAEDLRDAYQLEMDLVPMVLEMRRRGIRIDVDKAIQTRDAFLARRDELLKELGNKSNYGRALTMKDVGSDRFLIAMFTQEGVPFPKTAKGNPSFSKDWMDKYDHWLPNMVTKINTLHNAGDKFIGKYILEYCHHGRIHAEIHQYRNDRGGTRTSRFSYSDPPLQQMPSRDEEIAPQIRALFLPEEGEVWGALDYSQQEFRLIVHFASVCKMAGVEKAIRMYRDDPNTDFHDMVAELTGLPRRRAKDVNFAKAFGAGKYKFAEMTGMSVEEAVDTMDQYDEKLPFISRLSEFCQKRASKRGYIKLLDGMRSRFNTWEPRWVDHGKQNDHKRDTGWHDMPTDPCLLDVAIERTNDPNHYWYEERLRRSKTQKAMNWLIQGSAARQTKMAMRECWREGIVPLLQMHDELSSSFSTEAPAIRMKEIMVEVVTLEVPVMVDAEFGKNWGQAKSTWKEAVAK